ncbi:hypothetical protein QE357_000905 [Siphonobacter sp. BAB-5404]|nr:hypothetical protein [Siphonobacter sp. SORGH_AS_0500]
MNQAYLETMKKEISVHYKCGRDATLSCLALLTMAGIAPVICTQTVVGETPTTA